MARLWRLEREFVGVDAAQSMAARHEFAVPLWKKFQWLQFERANVAGGRHGQVDRRQPEQMAGADAHLSNVADWLRRFANAERLSIQSAPA